MSSRKTVHLVTLLALVLIRGCGAAAAFAQKHATRKRGVLVGMLYVVLVTLTMQAVLVLGMSSELAMLYSGALLSFTPNVIKRFTKEQPPKLLDHEEK